jgi:hypothetical protein
MSLVSKSDAPHPRSGDMRQIRLLVLIALLLGLSALVVPLGCKDAADTSPSSSLSTTTSTAAAPATSSAASETTLAQAPTTAPSVSGPTIAEQRARFRAASDLAHHGYAIIEYKSMPAPDWSAELIVHGKVVKVDPARWSTPDGREPDSRTEADNPARIYTTFYVEPTEVKGTPRFGTPIAIMVPFHDKLLAPGDEVLVFAEYYEEWRGKYGAWNVDAYFSIEEVRGIYMKVGEQYLNLESGQPCRSP